MRRLLKMLRGEPFEDRADAGRRLAARLDRYRDERPVLLALPRGGVPVAYEVARAFDAPLDVVVARKLGAPDQPEFGIGAVAPGGVRVLNEYAVGRLGIPEDYLARITRQETAEVERRLRQFRGDLPEAEVSGRTAILVDDGLATGVTARAALESLRRRGPGRVVLAAPVCAAQTARRLRAEVDDLVCLECPADLGAIGFWYRNFEQTQDEEVVELLEKARRGGRGVAEESTVGDPAGATDLGGDLRVPGGAGGVVLIAPGGGRRGSPGRYVARALRAAGLGTLLIHPPTADEEGSGPDTGLLAEGLARATGRLATNPATRGLRVGYFGAGVAAPAALLAAAEKPETAGAVVSCGGRPDLAGDALSRVEAPTLLILEEEAPATGMDEGALSRIHAEKRVEVLPGADRPFEEPGALEEVARLATGWFSRHLDGGPDAGPGA